MGHLGHVCCAFTSVFQTPGLALGLSLWRQLWVAEVAALCGYTRRQPSVWGTPGALLEDRLNLVPRKVERSVHVTTVELCGQGPAVAFHCPPPLEPRQIKADFEP